VRRVKCTRKVGSACVILVEHPK